MNKKYFLIALVCCIHLYELSCAQNRSLRLWYTKPAELWEETLPLGNGRLGMMPDGGVDKENIVLNDITMWSGAPQDANNYEAYKQLPEIRRLLLSGKNDQAQALIDQSFICTGKGSADVPFGCYQVLGNLHLDYTYAGTGNSPVKYTAYHRELSLNTATASCRYKVYGVTYKREYMTSFGDDVDMIRITADRPGAINCTIGIDRPERSATTLAGAELQLAGQLASGTAQPGVAFLARVRTKLKGGQMLAKGNSLQVRNATELIIYVAAATSFKNPSFRNSDRTLKTAMHKSYEEQKKLHVTSYQRLFNRVSLELGKTDGADEPTDKRLVSFHQNPQADKELPVLFFQFGRYLTICSTRVGLLPPNLQGLWANQIQTPWNGDYHLDVNVQMNHWPVEVANLSELNLPLVELVRGMVKPGGRTAKAYYNAEGWVAHVITNVWGFTEPGESASWGITKAGSGWLCNNIWDHYEFTNSRKYLQSIYPILKGSAQFYNSILIKDPKTGWQVTAPSSSPENSFFMPDGSGKHSSICIGATIDNQIIRELFNHVIIASEKLGLDAAFRKTLQDRLKELPPPGVISRDGRIMEWLEDYQETELNHRHISHLYGLYPASLITPESTPALALAAKKTLEVRGDDGPSWSIAYKLLFWARLHDGNRAYKLFTEIMKPTVKTDINYGAGGGIYPNLLSAGPPFQIDGNFGTTAGIAEMLLQSHAGFIDFIPAIPDSWKPSGEIKGLKARGNFTVDFTWKDGRVTSYHVRSTTAGKVKIRINGQIKEIQTELI